MNSSYVTDKAISLIKQLHGTVLGAKEFSGGFMPERVDAILFNSTSSFLIETKISRADFKADAKKSFRQNGGVGRYRYYACPEGLIKPEELPEKWGLIYVRPNNQRSLMPVGYGGSINIGEGWLNPNYIYFGTQYSHKEHIENGCEGEWYESPMRPEKKFSFDERCLHTEWRYMYAFCTRLQSGKFPKNIITEEPKK